MNKLLDELTELVNASHPSQVGLDYGDDKYHYCDGYECDWSDLQEVKIYNLAKQIAEVWSQSTQPHSQ